jgi:tetratricopeptide (TPR) repeat protein
MKKFNIFILIVFFLSIFPTAAQYQGKIEGVVKNKEGAPLKDVEVDLIYSKSSSRYFKLKTDSEGKFTQIGLYPGFYQLNIKHPGYSPLSREVRIRIAETTELEITLEKAEKALERALSDADNHFMQGYKLYDQQKYEEAVSEYKQAIEKNPGQWGYYFNLGLAYKKTEELDKAIEAFKTSVELNPEGISSVKELGESLALAERFEEARPYYDQAACAIDDDPVFFYNYGSILNSMGEPQKALDAYIQAVTIQKDYADAYYQMGTLYISQNKKEEAIKSLEKFLELAPDHEQAPIARQLLDYLKQ